LSKLDAWLLVAGLLGVIGCSNTPSEENAVTPFYDLRESGRVIGRDIDRIERAIALRSGLVVFTEPYRLRVVFLDPATGTQVAFGREGRGPGEFEFAPKAAIRLAGDTVGVLSQVGGSMHLFTPSDGYARSVATPIRAMPDVFDCHSDDDGVVYCAIEGTVGGRSRINPDSARPTLIPVIRFRSDDVAFDSIWSVPGRGYKRYVADDGSVMTRPEARSPISGFGVSADGTVWRVLGKELRVEVRRRDGTVVIGPNWNLKPQRVSAQERDSILTAWRTGRFGKFPLTVHETTPVFRRVVVVPSGFAWVRLSDLYGDNRYRVFDSRGRHVADADLRGGDVLVGGSPSTLFLLREDASGDYTLLEVALPESLRSPGAR